ncbi:MAG: Crp/Fnr family transcriptional regulator [Saprospiraceae bacterium]|nr:Crp/Fnr family transcriptional regulator [Saprospiraceae bacterium]MBL0026338.1 Crp/Fnr family transcriptional regulator [Saprospiraceae bacterium]
MRLTDVLTALKNFSITSCLSDEELSFMVKTGEIRTVEKNDFIFRQGEVSDEVFFLLEGVIKITSSVPDGREVIKMMLHPKSILSEQSIAGEEFRVNNAVAMTQEATVLAVEVEVIKNLIRNNPELAFCIVDFIGKKLRYTEDRLESLALNDARERIVQFLRLNAQSFGQAVGFEVLLKHDFTQQDIANFTGTSRQTVTTVMNDLKKNNQIYFRRKSILIRDIKALC